MVRVDFSATKPLNIGAGGSSITITGLGWACPKTPNQNATDLDIEIRYLGPDGVGSKDDVLIGKTSAKFRLTSDGEYALKFDEPMTAVVDAKKPFFRIDITARNSEGTGMMQVKRDDEGPKISVAGFSKAVD